MFSLTETGATHKARRCQSRREEPCTLPGPQLHLVLIGCSCSVSRHGCPEAHAAAPHGVEGKEDSPSATVAEECLL